MSSPTGGHRDDPDAPQLQPPLDPVTEEQVRARLAAARVSTPVPAEVAAGLDQLLGELTAQRSSARVRRGLGPRLLAAAAAVVVVGGGTVFGLDALQHGGGPAGSAGSASSQADGSGAQHRDGGTTLQRRATPGPSAAGKDLDQVEQQRLRELSTDRGPTDVPGNAPAYGARSLPPGASAGSGSGGGSAGGLPELRLAHFHADVKHLFAHSSVGGMAPSSPSGDPSDTTEAPAVAAEAQRTPTAVPGGHCPGPPSTGDDVRRAVKVDGQRAVLVITEVRQGRRAEAWTCDGSRMLAGTTVTG